MISKVENAIFDLDKVDALMYVIEHSCLSIEVMPGYQKQYDRGTCAFYALWDAIHKVAVDLSDIANEQCVIDVMSGIDHSK